MTQAQRARAAVEELRKYCTPDTYAQYAATLATLDRITDQVQLIEKALQEGTKMTRQPRYQLIIFMQDSNADEPDRLRRDTGEEAAVNYLAQWDYGEYTEEPMTEAAFLTGIGYGDRRYKSMTGDYMLTWHPGGLYYALYRLT